MKSEKLRVKNEEVKNDKLMRGLPFFYGSGRSVDMILENTNGQRLEILTFSPALALTFTC